MYGAECWPATKEVETSLSAMETKMLRWTAGVTRMDRIRSDAIRQKANNVEQTLKKKKKQSKEMVMSYKREPMDYINGCSLATPPMSRMLAAPCWVLHLVIGWPSRNGAS
ncbi:unnamed protein product [Heligmosomoides polygyrus]|uniref:Remorin_C domain-containing protein n=1 Tax=Heligmosomoides polygyrus TaxID=6339 RepID=A0A183GNG4_HELPZ|nr:unnamed protein product [Heligmosomoides polygyrus]